jgi:hypothetical protein
VELPCTSSCGAACIRHETAAVALLFSLGRDARASTGVDTVSGHRVAQTNQQRLAFGIEENNSAAGCCVRPSLHAPPCTAGAGYWTHTGPGLVCCALQWLHAQAPQLVVVGLRPGLHVTGMHRLWAILARTPLPAGMHVALDWCLAHHCHQKVDLDTPSAQEAFHPSDAACALSACPQCTCTLSACHTPPSLCAQGDRPPAQEACCSSTAASWCTDACVKALRLSCALPNRHPGGLSLEPRIAKPARTCTGVTGSRSILPLTPQRMVGCFSNTVLVVDGPCLHGLGSGGVT